jgi:cell division septation protein DedD
MRGVFDERDAERDRRKRGREKRDRENGRETKRDREVTLGWFTLLAIFLGLVMLCGLSFGLGYVVGRREPAASSTVLEPTPIAAQGDSAKSKPPGGSGGGSGLGSGGGAAAEAQSVEGGEAGEAGGETGTADASKDTRQAAKSVASTAPMKPALPSIPVEAKPQQTQSKTSQPALEPATKKALVAAPLALMVQVATLAHEEDADVLVQALRRKGYAVGSHRDMADGMVHVRVGPFASRDAANQWRQKLLNDGYNAVVETQ